MKTNNRKGDGETKWKSKWEDETGRTEKERRVGRPTTEKERWIGELVE